MKAFSGVPQSFYTALTAFVTADFSAFQPKITDTIGLVIVYIYIFVMSAIILSLLIAIVEESSTRVKKELNHPDYQTRLEYG